MEGLDRLLSEHKFLLVTGDEAEAVRLAREAHDRLAAGAPAPFILVRQMPDEFGRRLAAGDYLNTLLETAVNGTLVVTQIGRRPEEFQYALTRFIGDRGDSFAGRVVVTSREADGFGPLLSRLYACHVGDYAPAPTAGGAGMRDRLFREGVLVGDGVAEAVSRWEGAAGGPVIVEGPPGCGKLTIVEAFARAKGLRLFHYAAGATARGELGRAGVVVVEKADRIREESEVELLRMLAEGRATPAGEGIEARPLLVFASEHAGESEAIVSRFLSEPRPVLRLGEPTAEQKAEILALRLPGCPEELISDCLLLAALIAERGLTEQPPSLRTLIDWVGAMRNAGAVMITPRHFDAALPALAKTAREFEALSGARDELLEALVRLKSGSAGQSS